MSFFSKLRHALGGTSEREISPELATLRSDRRLHARFSIAQSPHCRVELANGVIGTVFDVSYSGLACRFPAGTTVTDQAAAKLIVLDASTDIVVTAARTPGQARDGHVFIGLHVLHQKPESLVFMRDLIEPLRSGQSFQPIEDHMRKDQYRGPDWSCLRGEGPVDYLVRSEGGTPTEALLTFVVGGRYCELMLKDGAVKTGVAQGQTSSVAPGANMAQTVAPDTQVLRRAIFILLGVPTKLSHLTQPMLDAAVASLSRDGKIVAA